MNIVQSLLQKNTQHTKQHTKSHTYIVPSMLWQSGVR